MKNFLIIFSILGLVSCAPTPEKTKAKISFGAIATADVFPGGLYILIHKPDPKRNDENSIAQISYVKDTNFDIELENGEWEFGAIGWDYSKEKFQGEPKCFFSGLTRLDGGEKTIDLNVSNKGCSSEPFFREGFMGTSGAPRQTRIISCAGLIARDMNQYNTETGYLCNDYAGKHTSFRFVSHDIPMGPVIDMDRKKFNPQNSVCMSAGALGPNIGTNAVHMPIYEGIPQQIIAYEGSNCTGSSRTYNFPRGIKNGSVIENSGFALPNSSSNTNDIYLNTAFCTTEDIASTSTIESGLGTEVSPWVICSGAELGLMDNAGYGLDRHYILGRNITTVAYSTPVGAFTGSFDGGGKEIRNLSAPLFNNIGNGAEIRDFTLRNVSIDTNSEIYLGALSQSIDGTGYSIRIENISLDNIDLSNSVTTCAVGALIGRVNVTGISDIKINDIDMFDNSASPENNISGSNTCDVGGLIGRVEAANQGDIEVEHIHLNNLRIENENSSNSTGGIFGYASNINLFHSHIESAIISGEENVGGLIGYGSGTNIFASAFSSDSGNDTRLECSFNNDDFTNPATPGVNSINCSNFGGIIGHAEENNILNNILAVFRMNEDNDIINNLGGVAGRTTSNTSFNKISNAGAIINIEVNGNNHGGIVGFLNESIAIPAQYGHILNSVVIGNLAMHEALNGTHNLAKGGLVGQINTVQGRVKGSIANVSLFGTEYFGGLAGQSNGTIKESVLFNSNMVADTQFEGQNFIVGGLVGQNGANGFIQDSAVINSNIEITGDTDQCSTPANQACGRILGENNNNSIVGNDSAANFVSFVGSSFRADGDNVAQAIGGTDNNLELTTAGMSAADYTTPNNISHAILVTSTLFTEPGIGRPWTFNGSFGYIPLFFNKHYALGFNPDENRIKVGNIFERLSIRNINEWNSIQDDAYLLGKALGLGNDLNFSGETFIPIGVRNNLGTLHCGNNTFYGALLGNDDIDADHSFRLIGIELNNNFDTGTCNGNSIGIISELGVLASDIPSIIGSEEHPLIVDNLKFNLGNTPAGYIGAVVGTVNNGYIFAKVSNSEINSGYNSGNDAGGLVGHSGSGGTVAIHNSLFSGRINTPGYYNVGGLLGSSGGGGTLSLNNNLVEVRDFEGYDYIGGLLGSTGSPNILNIQNNIVAINSNSNLQASSGSAGESVAGAIGSYFSGASQEYIGSNIVIYGDNAQLISTEPTYSFTSSPIGTADFNIVIGRSSIGNADELFQSIDAFLSGLGLAPFKGIYYDDQDNRLKQYWQHPEYGRDNY